MSNWRASGTTDKYVMNFKILENLPSCRLINMRRAGNDMLEKLHRAAFGFVRIIDLDQCRPEPRPGAKSKESMPGQDMLSEGREGGDDQAATDMMMSRALGSGMAIGVMAWESRKRSSFLVRTSSSTMAKCGRRERFVICRA